MTSILQAGPSGQKVAVAVLLQQSEAPELEAARFNGLSPVSYALAVADRENLPYVVVVQGGRPAVPSEDRRRPARAHRDLRRGPRQPAGRPGRRLPLAAVRRRGSARRRHAGPAADRVAAFCQGLRYRRDRLPFDAATDAAVRRLLDVLQPGKVEVRRYEDGFLPARPFIFQVAGGGLVVGSANITPPTACTPGPA